MGRVAGRMFQYSKEVAMKYKTKPRAERAIAVWMKINERLAEDLEAMAEIKAASRRSASAPPSFLP